MASKELRRICGITYLSEKQLINLIESKSAIRRFAYIYHDKDIYTADDTDDEKKIGTLKEPHYHFIFCLRYPYKEFSLRNWFKGFYDDKGESINTRIEKNTSPHQYYRYFYHLDNPDKFQYPLNSAKSDDSSYFKIDNELADDSAFSALEMMLEGFTVYEIAKIYGKDFIYHYGHIKQVYLDIINKGE